MTRIIWRVRIGSIDWTANTSEDGLETRTSQSIGGTMNSWSGSRSCFYENIESTKGPRIWKWSRWRKTKLALSPIYQMTNYSIDRTLRRKRELNNQLAWAGYCRP